MRLPVLDAQVGSRISFLPRLFCWQSRQRGQEGLIPEFFDLHGGGKGIGDVLIAANAGVSTGHLEELPSATDRHESNHHYL